jgi:hypothetical protein
MPFTQTPFVHPAIARLCVADRDLFTVLIRAGRDAAHICVLTSELADGVGTSASQVHERLDRLEQTRLISAVGCTCEAHQPPHLRIALPRPINPSEPMPSTLPPPHLRAPRRPPQRVPKTRLHARSRAKTLDVLKQRAQGRPWTCFVAKSLLPGVSREALKPRLRELRDLGFITVERCACREFLSVHTRVNLLPASGHRVTHAQQTDAPLLPGQRARQTARSFVHGLLALHADRELTLAEINEQLAETTRYDRSTLKTAVHDLHSAGLIEPYRGPNDRAMYWRITSAGLALQPPALATP